MYETILQNTHLRFPEIQKILRVGRAQGKTVSSLMNHVVQWLNPVPSSGDRLQLWQGLLPDSPENGNGDARVLQSEIFNLVRDRTDELTGAFLTQLPKDAKDSYLKRFQLPIWRDILVAVHKAIGPRFQGALCQFNTQDPAGLPLQRESTFIQAFRDAISHIPHVARNPALRSSKALEALMSEISPAITTWALQQCDEALQEQGLGRTPSWPPSVRELVKRQQSELEGTVTSSSCVKELTSSSAVPRVRPESRQSERYDGESAVEDMAEDVLQGVPINSARRDDSEKPEEAASQEPMEENPTTESSFLDVLPNLEEMKKRHRRGHSTRRPNGNPHLPSRDVYKVPHDERRKEHPRPPSLAASVHAGIAKARGKSPWMDSPAAQGGSRRLH